jgi:REP element-mobilizing transposase RayT
MKRAKLGREFWHVFDRGARRLDLFHEEADRWRFLELLRAALEATGCVLFAYALMSNHYHLIIQATSLQLTRCMRRLNHLYSLYHNQKYGFQGHAFDGPYRAYPQGTLTQLLFKLAYVFLNPVVAGLVRHPEDYAWSCYRDYLGLGGSPLRVEPSEILRRIDPNPAVARREFSKVIDRLARRPNAASPGVPTAFELARLQFEWLLDQAVEQTAPEGMHPAEIAIYRGRLCGVPPRVMAAVLGDMTGKRVSDVFYRLKEKLSMDPALAARLALR